MKTLCAATLAFAFTYVISSSSAEAAVLAYDGFASGCDAPSSSQYYTGSTYPRNTLAYYDPTLSPSPTTGGQNPTTAGFSGAWFAPNQTNGQTASTVSFKTQAASLNYTDTLGNILATTAGSVISGRTNAGAAYKTVGRALDFTSTSNTFYVSTLVSFNAGQMIEFDFRTLGTNSKPFFGFGIDTTGKAYVQLSPATNANSYLDPHSKISTAATSLAANTTHMLVFEVTQNLTSPQQDTIRLYVNPLLNQPLTGAVATLTDDFYVPNNPEYAWSNMHITTLPNAGFVTFDEIAISDSWMGAVPEPSQAALLMTAALGFAIRRKRTKTA